MRHVHYCHPGRHWYRCPGGHTSDQRCPLLQQIDCTEHIGWWRVIDAVAGDTVQLDDGLYRVLYNKNNRSHCIPLWRQGLDADETPEALAQQLAAAERELAEARKELEEQTNLEEQTDLFGNPL